MRTTTRFDDVLRDPSVDAVVIASPPVSHYGQARAVILSGKDVFVEKRASTIGRRAFSPGHQRLVTDMLVRPLRSELA